MIGKPASSIWNGFILGLVLLGHVLASRDLWPRNGSNSDISRDAFGFHSPDFIYLGCVASSGARFRSGNIPDYDENHTPASCAEKCRGLDPALEVIFLRGALCQCALPVFLQSIAEWSVKREACNIPCPVKDYDPRRTYSGNKVCGGNQYHSVYSISGYRSNRIKVIHHLFSLRAMNTNNSMEMDWKTDFPKPVMEEEQSCAVCDYSKQELCKIPNLVDAIHSGYFPANSPSACVEYCGSFRAAKSEVNTETNSTNYVSQITTTIDDPTPFALMSWYKGKGNKDIPICRCMDKNDRDIFTPVDPTHCNRPCPGNREVKCGGLETNGLVYSTIYCVDGQDKECKGSGTSGSAASRLEGGCRNATCQKTDMYGFTWKGCGARDGPETIPCSKLIANASGLAYWDCSAEGKFMTPQPDVGDCHSPWMNVLGNGVNGITQVAEADTAMEKLKDKCQDSDSSYFGEEINEISSFVTNLLSKANQLTDNTDSSQLDPIVQNAVSINSMLIRNRKPWEVLQRHEKSSISTSVLQSTEYAMFSLTKKHAGQDYRKNYTFGESKDKDDQFKFFIFAETFNERGADDNYEFPRRDVRRNQDSFIKLPPGWTRQVKSDAGNVQIAAMSIGADYVGHIMPGQYEELGSSDGIIGQGNFNGKLINGKLISLSVASPVGKEEGDQQTSFVGKGAEITFYHDIEASGEEKPDVPRKLHESEKPTAILGTAQCVSWDRRSSSWTANGCRVVRSDGFKTVCECSHLTSFAVLMDVHRYVGKHIGLGILTLILCTISEIALILTIIILHFMGQEDKGKQKQNNLQRITMIIRKNLAVCLLIGNAMVLFVLDRNNFNLSEAVCFGAAMLTHYIFLCSFMWMLFEGVHLYRLVVLVFDKGRSYLKYFILAAYGSPLLVIGTTVTTGFLREHKPPYGGDVYCWLKGSYIWSFMAPVAVIVGINLVLLIIVSKASFQYHRQKNHNKKNQTLEEKMQAYKVWLRACVLLTFILGVTWIFGFFTLFKSPGGIVAAYIFTILNASQGIFIFLLNCVFNEKARTFLKRKFSTCFGNPPSRRPSISFTSKSDVNYESTNVTRPIRPALPPKRSDTDSTSLTDDSKSKKPLIQELESKLMAVDGDMAAVNQRPLRWKAETKC